jgi:hypothetical protein
MKGSGGGAVRKRRQTLVLPAIYSKKKAKLPGNKPEKPEGCLGIFYSHSQLIACLILNRFFK